MKILPGLFYILANAKQALMALLFIVSLALIGCASSAHTTVLTTTSGGTDTLQDVQDLGASKTRTNSKKQLSPVRIQALQETALSTGAQAALAWRAKQLNAVLEHNAKTLDETFNFRGIMLKNNVLPPVLSEGRQTLNLADGDTIRLADRAYKIEAQAHFVTAPPNWRDYLLLNFTQPQKPHASLLPQNSRERAIWHESATKGWEDGIKQAESIYAENVFRLQRDYNGMVLYRKLYAQRMVSAPYVVRTHLGVTGSGSDMRINDQVLRITALPNLLPNAKNWRPIAVVDNQAGAE